MNFQEKLKSLKCLKKDNRILQVAVLVLSILSLFLTVALFSKTERWVLVPMNLPEKRLVVTNEGVTSGYLKEWAQFVSERLFNASSDTVVAQVGSLKVLASRSESLDDFFKKHIAFVKSSHIESTFYPKEFKVFPTAVEVRGLFKYWIGRGDVKPVSQKRTYRFSFKQGVNDLILLTNIKEVKHEKK